MGTHQENNKRIAKNTIVLYVRMIFVLLVALYTSRVLLDVLGVEDYGVYNVVGGVVTMLGFFNGAMVASTQRFFSFAIGQEDIEQLNRNYSTILLIQGGLALLVILLAETVGLWFVRTYLVIPPERMSAALWVYHFAVFSFVLSMLQVPFTALIITHERMNVYALISICDVALKLLLVLVLPYLPFDKLISYAVLLFCVALITCSTYMLYCKVRLRYVRVIKRFDRNLFRVLLSYMGWNLWGNSAAVIMGQGINILLNIFFGPAVNAARAIAYQVQGALNQLVANFQLALNPPIVKSYARGEMDYMHRLIISGSKLSFALIFSISLPIILETETLLSVWLKSVPEHAVLFTKLTMIFAITESISGPLMCAIQSTGRIALYQTVVGGMLILNLPVSYVVLKLGGSPEATVVVSIIISLVAFIFRVFIVSPRISISRWRLLKEVFLKSSVVSAVVAAVCLFAFHFIGTGIASFVVLLLISVAGTALSMYFLALDNRERHLVAGKVSGFFYRSKS